MDIFSIRANVYLSVQQDTTPKIKSVFYVICVVNNAHQPNAISVKPDTTFIQHRKYVSQMVIITISAQETSTPAIQTAIPAQIAVLVPVLAVIVIEEIVL